MSTSSNDADPRPRGRVPDWWLPATIWAAAALLGYLSIRRGWLPHDAGVLGHASERVLAGELPHRDFHDTYTGGLALLNAVAFKVLGVGILSMRWVFFAAYLAWVPLFWMVAKRLAGRGPAAIGTLLAAAASLPVYPEGMPSWYNLFLATAGVWALLRHEADGRPAWLVAAGAAGGLSILFKVIGLFYLAGAGLYLLCRERAVSIQQSAGAGASGATDRPYRIAVLAVLALVAVATAATVLRAGNPVMFLYFGVPPLMAVAAVAARVASSTREPAGDRFRRLVGWTLLVGLGAAVPVALFALPYAASGSLDALWQGVFVLPQSRFLHATWTPPPLMALVPALAVAAWLTLAPRAGPALQRSLVAGALVVLAAGLALSHTEPGYRAFWYLISGSGVVLAAVYGWKLARAAEDPAAGVLVLGVFSYHALVQIPFAAPVYALYAFPMMVLLALAAAAVSLDLPRRSLHVILAGLLVFVLLRVDTGFLYHMGFRYRPHNQVETLDLPRAGGIRVSAVEKAEYEGLAAAIESLDPGPWIYAFPDSPEVYFLTGLRNPTASLFDFLDPDLEGRDELVLRRLDELGVRVAVLNRRPLFSGPPEAEFLSALEARYPNAREVGRFLVVWAEREPGS